MCGWRHCRGVCVESTNVVSRCEPTTSITISYYYDFKHLEGLLLLLKCLIMVNTTLELSVLFSHLTLDTWQDDQSHFWNQFIFAYTIQSYIKTISKANLFVINIIKVYVSIYFSNCYVLICVNLCCEISFCIYWKPWLELTHTILTNCHVIFIGFQRYLLLHSENRRVLLA